MQMISQFFVVFIISSFASNPIDYVFGLFVYHLVVVVVNWAPWVSGGRGRGVRGWQ